MTAHLDTRLDLSQRDHLANIVVLAPTRRRRSLSPEVAAGYWLDAHGPAIAALPGLSLYTQHHLLHDRGDLWPRLRGVGTDIAEDEQLDGLAELGFADDEGAEAFGAAAAEANVMEDEQNVFAMVIVQQSPAGWNRTIFDCLLDPVPNGELPYLKVMLALRRNVGAPAEGFRSFLLERFGPALAEHELVHKVRVSLVEDFLPEHWSSPNVEHDVPIAQQYQAYVEVVVKHRLDLMRVHGSPEFVDAVDGLPDVATHVNAFPVRATHAFVFQGRRTLAGELGAHRARLVMESGSLHLWTGAAV